MPHSHLLSNVEFGSSLCYCSGRINGTRIEVADFGFQGDRSPQTAEEYGCGDMKFTRKPYSAEVLKKYKIDEPSYDFICTLMEEKLSFGACGLCI